MTEATFNMKEKIIERLKELNAKWFDKPLIDYKSSFNFPIKEIPFYEEEDIKNLDNYIKYYILQPPVYKLNFHKQLSRLDFYYLGGSHSRFEHVVGTTIIGSKIIEILNKVDKNRNDLLGKWENLAFLTALLIHDCGQPPFSHSLELLKNFFISKLKISIPTDQKLDKIILSYYLNDNNSNLIKMLENPWIKDDENKKYNKENKDNFLDLIKSLFDFKAFKKKYTDKCFLYELLNSDYDCDRFDWIGRDSMHLGLITEKAKYISEIMKLFRNVKFCSITEEGITLNKKLAFSMYDNDILSNLSTKRKDLYNNYYHSASCRIFDTVFPNLIYRFLLKYDLIIHRDEQEKFKEDKNDILKEILKLPDFELINFIDYVENIYPKGKSWYISHALIDLFGGHFPSIKYEQIIYKNIYKLEETIDDIEKQVKQKTNPRSSDKEKYDAYLQVINDKYKTRNSIPIEVCLYYLCSLISSIGSQHIFPIQQNFWKQLLKTEAFKRRIDDYLRYIKKEFEKKKGESIRNEIDNEIISYPQIFISIPQYISDFIEVKELNISRKEKQKGFETYLYESYNNNKHFPLRQDIPEQKADYYYSVFLLIPDYLEDFEKQIIEEFEEFLRDLSWWKITI